MHAFVEKVEQYIKQHEMLKARQQVLVGVSGGADSVALLLGLLEISRKGRLNLALSVAHLDHCLRGPAGRADAEFVTELGKKLQLPVYNDSTDVAKLAATEGVSLETAGRKARYEFFARVAKDQRCTAVALAHQANDQVETVLHRIVRGTGLAGLKGIEPKRLLREKPQIHIIRPLLACRREQIEQFLRDKSVSWRIDHTNQTSDVTRNRIRNEMLPMLREKFNPQVDDALLRLAGLAGQTNDFLQMQASKLFQRLGKKFDSLICIDLQKLTKEHLALQAQLLRLSWSKLALPERNLSLATIEDILTLACEHLANQRLARLSLPAKAQAVCQFNKLLLWDKQRGPSTFKPTPLPVPGRATVDSLGLTLQARLLAKEDEPAGRMQPEDPNTELIDSQSVHGQLQIRPPKMLETFKPLTGKTSQMAKFLTDCRIPKLLQPLIAVVADEEGPLWVVGYRLAQRVRITAKTCKAIEFSCRWKNRRPRATLLD